MDPKYQQLVDIGYEIVWTAGNYCRACLAGRDQILRWTGDGWISVA